MEIAMDPTMLLCPAIVSARESVRLEVARHSTALRDLERKQRLAEEAMHRQLDQELDDLLKSMVVADRGLANSSTELAAPEPLDEQRSPSPHGDCRIFMAAALQLVEDKLQSQTWGAQRTGYLRKAAHLGRSSWRFQRVELRREAGAYWLAYVAVPDSDQDASKSLRMPRKKAAAVRKADFLFEGKERRIRLLPGGKTACVPTAFPEKGRAELLSRAPDSPTQQMSSHSISHAPDDCIFAVKVADHASLWMASSSRERDDWMRAIRDASERSVHADNHIYGDGGSVFSGDHLVSRNVTDFVAALDRVALASNREQFVQALKAPARGEGSPRPSDQEGGDAAFSSALARFHVPVHWARRYVLGADAPSMASPSGSVNHQFHSQVLDTCRSLLHPMWRTSNNEGGRRDVETTPFDASRLFTQMRKDMRRDRVSIDGEIVRSDNCREHHEEIARVLATRILLAANEIKSTIAGPLQSSGGDVSCMTEASALVHACAILIASTRTSSGGDAYTCVQALCRSMSGVVVCPLSTKASPLEFDVQPVSNSTSPKAVYDQRSAMSNEPQSSESSFMIPSTFATRLFVARLPSPRPSEDSTTSASAWSQQQPKNDTPPRGSKGCLSSKEADDEIGNPEVRRDHVSVRATATTAYRICDTNPQDLPSDTWALVRAVWRQEFCLYCDPSESANLRVCDAAVEMTISEIALWDSTDTALSDV